MENEDNERCCGNCISFTDEDGGVTRRINHALAINFAKNIN